MTRSKRPGPIRFGTSGWRGVLGDEITLPRAVAVVGAVARWIEERGLPPRVLLAHDTRPGGARLADAAAEALAGRGLRVDRAARAVPTPVASRAVAHGDYGAGLVFTASHNPPADHGLKVLGPSGGSLERAHTRRLEALARGELRAAGASSGRRRGSVREIDPLEGYLAALGRAVDGAAIARARPTVYYDAMHGAGAGVLDRFLADAGARVVARRTAADARFGGVGPDPAATRLAALAQAVRGGRGLRLALATDGDADRYAALDAQGQALSATQAVALLVDHLASTGRIRRGVAISVATGSLVQRVARAHGLRVVRTRIGFKWLSRALLEGAADCAGEESGGFVWAAHGVDKDGVLSGALLTERVSQARRPLRALLDELEARHGACHCGRAAVAAGAEARDRLARWIERPPHRIGGARVLDVDRRDGVRLGLADGFLMLRGSGTEPAIRIYAEAPSASALRSRLRQGALWLAPGTSINLPI